MSRTKTFESGPQDVERPLLRPGDEIFDELAADAGSAPDSLRKLALARSRGRLAHAILLAGPEGCGKRWVAARLAQLLSCERGGDSPCRKCNECLRTERGLDTDVLVLEPAWDERKGERKNEISVDQVRKTQDLLGFRSAGRRRVVIVDPADRLSAVAQEALLKTLEEPPQGVTLLLITSRPSFLKPTIRSRAPQLRVVPPAPATLASVLARRKALSPDQAELAARLSGGNARAALELDAGDVAERWVGAARTLYEIVGPKGERRARDLAVDIAPSKGEDGGSKDDVVAFLALLERLLRDALVAGTCQDRATPLLLNPQAEKAAHALAQRLPPDAATRALAAVETARDHLALNMNAKVVLTHLMLVIHGLRAA